MTTYFTEDHEWIAVEGASATLGITSHAAERLGDIVFVELRDAGTTLSKGDECGVVESVKAASEIYAPASGEISEVNPGPVDDPASLGADPQGAAWLVKMTLSDPSELEGLMDAAAYADFIGS